AHQVDTLSWERIDRDDGLRQPASAGADVADAGISWQHRERRRDLVARDESGAWQIAEDSGKLPTHSRIRGYLIVSEAAGQRLPIRNPGVRRRRSPQHVVRRACAAEQNFSVSRTKTFRAVPVR